MTTQVDFDYNGPPVSVSNGMAVQLVSQFGVRNAWFAFLKLRGMKISNEEAERAQTAFDYFRNKIGHLRREANELKAGEQNPADNGDRVEQLNALMGADFDNFLAAPDSLELRSDVPTYTEVDEKTMNDRIDAAELSADSQHGAAAPTMASLLQVIQQSKNNKKPNQQVVGGEEKGQQKDEETAEGGKEGGGESSQQNNVTDQQAENTKNGGNNQQAEEGEEEVGGEKEEAAEKSERAEEAQTPGTAPTDSVPAEEGGDGGMEKSSQEQEQQQKTTAAMAEGNAIQPAAQPAPPPTAATAKGQKQTGKSHHKASAKNVAAPTDDAETKQVVEKLLAAKEEIARRHAETIDDVVSLVMEKIRNNQPFEGELAVGTLSHAGPAPSKSHHHHKRAAAAAAAGGVTSAGPSGHRMPAATAQAGGGSGSSGAGAAHQKRGGGAAMAPALDEMMQPQPGVYGTAEILHRQQMPPIHQQQQQSAAQQQQQFPAPISTTISSGLSAGAPIMATGMAGAFSQFPAGQPIVLLHNPVTGSMQIPTYSVGTAPAKAYGGGGQQSAQMQMHHQPPSHSQQQQQSADQVTILSNYSDIIRSQTTSAWAATTAGAAMGKAETGGEIHMQQPFAGGAAAVNHQLIGKVIGEEEGAGTGAGGIAAMPLEMAIQQNMTVQELIQTLKAQSRHQNTQIILHHAPNLPQQPQPPPPTGRSHLSNIRQPHFQQQQETPDSSSQEAHDKFAPKQTDVKGTNGAVGGGVGASKTVAAKKGRKRNAVAAAASAPAAEAGMVAVGGQPPAVTSQPPPSKQQKMQQQQQQQMAQMGPFRMGVAANEQGKTEMGGKNEEPAGLEAAAPPDKKKPSKGKKGKQQQQPEREQPAAAGATAIPVSAPSTSAANKPAVSSAELKQQQERIDELESQLRKVNKQLSTEHNKSAAQKKRVEKLQAELDKTVDTIQLLQIDLACQKTDNNNLIAENIALKAENQQLRSKGQRAAVASSSSTASSNAAPATSTTAAASSNNNNTRGRKKKATGLAEETADQIPTKTAKGGRGRKGTAATPVKEKSPSFPLPERTRTPPPLQMELGRRQSKRICVARNQFIKNLF